MAKYTLSHRYAAIVTHEVTYELPEGLSAEEAVARIQADGLEPVKCEPVDEEFTDDLGWDLLLVQ